MKKKFKDTKVGKILKPVGNIAKSILLGTNSVTLSPVLAAGKAIVQEIEENKNSENGGVGKVDWVRIIAMVGTLALMGLVIAGKIDLETFDRFIEILGF